MSRVYCLPSVLDVQVTCSVKAAVVKTGRASHGCLSPDGKKHHGAYLVGIVILSSLHGSMEPTVNSPIDPLPGTQHHTVPTLVYSELLAPDSNLQTAH